MSYSWNFFHSLRNLFSGTDIPPGSTLSGFLSQFDTRIGPVPFTATFFNTTDPNDPLIFNKTSEPAGYRVYLPMVLK